MRITVRILAVGLAVAAVGIGAGAGHAASPPLAVEYVALLGDASAALDASPPRVDDALHTLRALEADPRIAAAGFVPSVALDPVIADLNPDHPDLGDARSRLRQMEATLRLPENSVAPLDPGAPGATLRSVYSGSAFADLDRPPQQSLLDHLRDALSRLIDAVAGGLGIGWSIVLLVLLLGAVAGGTVWLVRANSAGRVHGLVPEPAGAGADAAAEWRLAEAAAARGDHREAVRRAFRSALLEVAIRGRLGVDPSWTTRELLAQARGDADLVGALAPASAAFDQAWYSGKPVDAAQWDLARRRCAAVSALARGQSVPA